MKGQIEEQYGNDVNAVREAYKQGVSITLLFVPTTYVGNQVTKLDHRTVGN